MPLVEEQIPGSSGSTEPVAESSAKSSRSRRRPRFGKKPKVPQVASPQVASPQVASPQVASPQVASPQVASPSASLPAPEQSSQTKTTTTTSSKPKSSPKPKAKRNEHLGIKKNRPQARLTTSTPSETKPKKPDRVPRKQKASEKPNQSKDLRSILTHDLKHASYECMVCWDVVKPVHRTWNCDCCWAVFHLGCIQKWAAKSLTDTSTNKVITAWRCPGCQYNRKLIPDEYLCYCGKQNDPRPNRYIDPHSCGQPCHRSRGCPHQCTLPCHPGPCPPCTAMGPSQYCYCAHDKRQALCKQTDYTTKGYSCERECERWLGCEKHTCEEKCHMGLCPPCMVEEEQTCYCGTETRTARCASGEKVLLAEHIGHYSCDKLCKSLYACGIHHCNKPCHPCLNPLTTCPFDPTVVKTCPCGSQSVVDLLGSQRQTCADPIPTCTAVCSKTLPCGHTCQRKCHEGDCFYCKEEVRVACRCGSTHTRAQCAKVCEDMGGKTPVCETVCRSLRQCGRHKCEERCCPAKGKRNRAEHVCPETCQRTLSCGRHKCNEPCHRGDCPPCSELYFDDLECNCGRTRVDAPVRCGTKLPPCQHPCARPTPCGHFRFLPHNCHPDDEPCPPCTVLVTKMCVCGKTELKNVPCHRESPRCGQRCEALLPCGKHKCGKYCHSNPCLAEGETCRQECGGQRRCGHPCQAPCHGDSSCPETDPCPTLVRAACKCKHNTIEIPCNATDTSSGSNLLLDCNDFCAKVERNRRLALALELNRDVVQETAMQKFTPDDLGYYDDSLCQLYLENPRLCRRIEATLCDFVRSSETTHHFGPMRSSVRRFIHRYSVHFNIATEAVDPEPYRSVIVRKSLGQCRVPGTLLSTVVRHPSLLAQMTPASLLSAKVANALCLAGLADRRLPESLTNALHQVLGPETIKDATFWTTSDDLIVRLPSDRTDLLPELISTLIPLKDFKIKRCHADQDGNVVIGDVIDKRQDVEEAEKSDHTDTNDDMVAEHDELNDIEEDANEEDEWVKIQPRKSFRIKETPANTESTPSVAVAQSTSEQPAEKQKHNEDEEIAQVANKDGDDIE